MTVKRLTDHYCLTARPTSRRLFVHDVACPGLVLSITETGYRSFMLRARFGLAPRPRQRVLNDAEIRALWTATATMGAPFGAFIRLLLLTGCRRGEIASLSWGEIDRERGLIVIPAARFKSGSEHHVPIIADVAALLDALPRYKSGDYVFTTTFGRRPIGGFSKCRRAADRPDADRAWSDHAEPDDP
jgi:integrase